MQFFIRIGILIFFGSCSVGPDYNPPISETPPVWKNTPDKVGSACYEDYWWEAFEDPLLNDLENEVLSRNYDLKLAYNRILEARAIMNAAKAELYPQIYLNPSYRNEQVLYESYSDNVIKFSHEQLYLMPLMLSYEVDLWGKIRDRYLAARHNFEGEIEAYNTVMLLLTADLATVYYQIRTTDSEIEILKKTLASREKQFRITNNRYKAKITNYSDVSRSGQEISNTLSKYHEALRIRGELENRLAVLIGTPSSEFCFEPYPLEGSPPQIPVGIPSEVLLRRPDIAEAERQMAAQHSLIKSAYASLFPSLSLTGAVGYSSPHIKFFLKRHSRYWAYGADGSQMLFDGGELVAELRIKEARFREASDDYQQKVLIVFEEVEDALSNLENYAKQYDDISQSVEWAKKTVKISNNRYKQGVSNFLDVVISEQDELANEIIQNELLGLRFLSTIELIKVMGGGWECEVLNSIQQVEDEEDSDEKNEQG